MSRLEEARAGLETVRFELDQEWWPAHCKAETDALTLALQRMAQLEKVAKLARTSVRGPDSQAAERATLLLDLALTELDNHPDTREPTTIVEKDQ